MAPDIPDGWLKYTPIGKRIDGTRFIAFKVPLRKLVNKDVAEKDRLDGKMLMRTIPNLGMIIDLTNTTRYYNPGMFQKNGIEYHKLMIPGHQTPPPHLAKQFRNIVKSFVNKNPENDKLIGVHCTHGVNRTGYLICNYMISELNMKPEEAIANFSIARGHNIERENYLQSLNNLRNAFKRNRNSRPIKQRNDTADSSHFVPSLTRSTFNNEPFSRRARPERKIPPPPPPPNVVDKRNRFNRFRDEANAQRQRYTHTDGAALTPAPAHEFAGNRFNSEMATNNSSNYNRRFVNTTSRRSRGGGNSYPYHHNNHHNQLTNASDAYDAQARLDRPFRSKTYQRQNRASNHDGNSGKRNFNRYQLDRRI
ncbi:RNA/RNP complex-1-interacting phosphatase homolog [Eurosta solidaginis]|uniref:RNA/RNP complex-1-interacting phosphatase homolog n=1 Tax=Eurosta solidaginis TaxID=178769 RepID=UPI0035314E20